MSKVVQISILGKVEGNVNADESIGSRITLKKMYSSAGEVLPFVSARAIKFAIRQALKEKGLPIDPLYHNPEAEETLKFIGKPEEYVDDDLFGFMVTSGKGEMARKRQAPIAISYFKALKDTPIKTEFAARFPRPWEKYEQEPSPIPFEVEVAEFIGRLNCIIYENVGRFEEKELLEESKRKLEKRKIGEVEFYVLPEDERKRRIKAFVETFLTPSYVLPRRTNSLCIPQYICALIVLSEKGPLPIFQYLQYDFEKNEVDVEKLKELVERKEVRESGAEFFFLDFLNDIEESKIPQPILKIPISEAIQKIVDFI